MNEKTHPKFNFSRKLGGGESLKVAGDRIRRTGWCARARRFESDWKTRAGVALYRTKDGTCSELPERTPAQAEGV